MITIEDIEKYEEDDISLKEISDCTMDIHVCLSVINDPESEYIRVYLGSFNDTEYLRFVNVSLHKPVYIGSDIKYAKTKFTIPERELFIKEMNKYWKLISNSLHNEYSNSKWGDDYNELYHQYYKDEVKLPLTPPDYNLLEVI